MPELPQTQNPLGPGNLPPTEDPLRHKNPLDTEPTQTRNPSDTEPLRTQETLKQEALGYGHPLGHRKPLDMGTFDGKPLDTEPLGLSSLSGPEPAARRPHLVLVPPVQLPLQDHSGSFPLPQLQEHGGCARKQRPQGRVYLCCSGGPRSARLTPQRHEDGEQHSALVVKEVGELEGGARWAGVAFPPTPGPGFPFPGRTRWAPPPRANLGIGARV